MAISIEGNTITVDNMVNIKFLDIYNYTISVGSNIIQKLSNTYLIAGNLILQNGTYLYDIDVSITITGELFQIKKGCTLKLGQISSTGRTTHGCILTLPNVLQEFGFGSVVTNDSGNLLAYESMINAYGYWSFFEGTNHVELIDCIIDGYGKISGSNSIIKDNTFKRSHGRYGTLIYIGSIKEYINNTIDSAEPYIEDDGYIANMVTLENDDTPDILEIYYGEYNEYNNLLYVLDTVYDYDIIMYGTKINNGYNITRTDVNKNSFYHKFRFNPIFQNDQGLIVTNIPIKIYDKYNNIVYDGLVDGSGCIDQWITYYQDLAGTPEGDILTPHKIEILYNEITINSIIYIDRNMEDFPILLYTCNSISVQDSAVIQNITTASQDTILYTITTQLTNIDSNLRQIMLGVGKDIKELPTIIERPNGQKMLL